MLGIFARTFYIATRRGEPLPWGPDHWRETEMTGPFDARHQISRRKGGRG